MQPSFVNSLALGFDELITEFINYFLGLSLSKAKWQSVKMNLNSNENYLCCLVSR